MALAFQPHPPDVRSGVRWTPAGLAPATNSDAPGDVAPDPSLDRFASLVRAVIGVPTSLVTIVEPDRQVFPGASGAAMHHGQAERQSPLARSICRFVVSERAPLFIGDLRRHAQLRQATPVSDAGVVAYAGHPLTDRNGEVIGSLCALDIAPRDWTAREKLLLADLAAACSAEIALRQLQVVATQSAATAWDASTRARTLLSITRKLSTAHTTADVAQQIHDIATEQLGCVQAGLWTVHSSRPGTLRHVRVPGVEWAFAHRLAQVPLSRENPFGRALIDDEPLFFADRDVAHRLFPEHITADDVAAGSRSGTCQPLRADEERLGTLVLSWPGDHEFSDEDHVLISALEVAAAGAVHRALLLDDQAITAARMQRAMLANLPDIPGMELAAVHRPARATRDVGGDWYDAVRVDDDTALLTVGEVVGHDQESAAIMGSARGALRAFAFAGKQDLAHQVDLLDRAMGELYSSPLVGLVHARVHRGEHDWTVEWTNAGHPEPVILGPDGSCRSLTAGPRNCLLGVEAGIRRHTHRITAEPGSTLIMYTDGLLGHDLDAGRDRFLAALNGCTCQSLEQMLQCVIDELVPADPPADVAVLAVRC